MDLYPDIGFGLDAEEVVKGQSCNPSTEGSVFLQKKLKKDTEEPKAAQALNIAAVKIQDGGAIFKHRTQCTLKNSLMFALHIHNAVACTWRWEAEHRNSLSNTLDKSDLILKQGCLFRVLDTRQTSQLRKNITEKLGSYKIVAWPETFPFIITFPLFMRCSPEKSVEIPAWTEVWYSSYIMLLYMS